MAEEGDMDFAGRYGQWVVVAGASEGVGAALALEVARRGCDVVLLARREEALRQVAQEIRQETAAQVRTVVLDLSEPTAAALVADATAGLDVGLLFYNAGADAEYRSFLDRTADAARAMVQRNCVVPTELSHHYAKPMVERGRGGIVIVSSGAAFAGAPNMVVYGASKAFDMVFAEALWTELHDQGVDVLGLMLGETDTPALRRLRAERGRLDDPNEPLPGVTTVDEVVADALEQLPNGPTWMVGEQLRTGATLLHGGMTRNELVALMSEASKESMG
jgi:short-subunit dehydrogenase